MVTSYKKLLLTAALILFSKNIHCMEKESLKINTDHIHSQNQNVTCLFNKSPKFYQRRPLMFATLVGVISAAVGFQLGKARVFHWLNSRLDKIIADQHRSNLELKKINDNSHPGIEKSINN